MQLLDSPSFVVRLVNAAVGVNGVWACAIMPKQYVIHDRIKVLMIRVFRMICDCLFQRLLPKCDEVCDVCFVCKDNEKIVQ